MLARIFIILNYILSNILITNFFNYLLLIMFDNGFIIEKNNLNLVLSEKYKMVYYFFETIFDLIPNDK